MAMAMLAANNLISYLVHGKPLNALNLPATEKGCL
jgi:hypothetical protein